MRQGAAWLGRHVGDQRAVAAVEFALVAPVMLVILFGTLELSNVFRAQAKVNTAAGMLAELIAGDGAVTAPSGSLADRCVGSAFNIAPFPQRYLSADIASITNDHPVNRVAGSTDTTTVATYLDWENVSSCATSAPAAMALTGAYALANAPASLLTMSGAPAASAADLAYSYSVIVVRTSYSYRNVLSFILGQTIVLTGTAVARPRSNATILCTTVASAAACPQLQ